MPSPITLKLPEKLKARLAALAKEAGKTSHAFMIELLQTHAQVAERRREFLASAVAAEEEVARTGVIYDADEVHEYLRARASGKKPRRPKPVKC
jgi:predicted transcriptional regulator